MSSVVRGLFVIAGVVLLGCQPAMVEPTVEPPQPRGQPHLLVDEGDRGIDTLVLSLTGSVGQDVSGSFRIINTGHGELELTQVSTFNGLVRAPGLLEEASPDFEVGLPRQPIASGAWVTVPVLFHARRGGASVASQLELRFGGGHVIVFSLVGEVLRSDCITAVDVDFGSARVGERIERVITLHNPAAGDQLVRLGRFVNERGLFSLVKPGELVRVPGNGDVELPVSWNPAFDGEHRATLELSSLRCLSSRVTLRGSAWRLPALDGPETLDFGRVEPLTRTISSVLVRNTLPRPVTLTAAVFGDEFSVVRGQTLTIPAALHEQPGQWRTSSIEVFIEAAPTAHGLQRGSLTLRDDEAGARLHIALVVDGGPERVVASAHTVHFGPVAFSSARRIRSLREVTVENTGSAPLRLGVPVVVGRFAAGTELCIGEVDDSGSCAPSLPALVAPGTLLRLPVTLTLADLNQDPTGMKSWSMSIPTDAPVTPTVELQVTATPVEAPPCSLELMTEIERQPSRALDFGEVGVGLSATGTVRLCNAAPASTPTEVCFVDSFRLRPTSAAFAMDHSTAGVVLPPGECEVVSLRAMPFVRGTVSAELEFMTSAPERGLVRLPLRVVGR